MGTQQLKPRTNNIEVHLLYKECRKSSQRQSTSSSKYDSESIFNQLFQLFSENRDYVWGREIMVEFHDAFINTFMDSWKGEKQQFYELLLGHCGNYQSRNQSHQSYFYAIAPKSIIKVEQFQNMEFAEMEMMQLINKSIINQSEDYPFVFHQKKKNDKQHFSQIIKPELGLETEKSIKFQSQYNERNIQDSSVIIPQTIFVDRLSQEGKDGINEFVLFYKCFSDSLQQMFRSLTMLACPLKHFQVSLRQKLKRKKIKQKSQQKYSASFRKKIQYNNALILTQLRNFIIAYTDFVWKYLELYLVEDTAYGEFITLETVEGIILKTIWSFAGWIGERGFEYEESLLPRILSKWKINKELQIPQKIVEMGMKLTKQGNPQKYLKKIVIIYRQLGSLCSCADELLIYLQKVIYCCVKKGRYERLFKMQNIINKVMSIPESNGQISYAWVSWNVILEMMKGMVENLSKEKL